MHDMTIVRMVGCLVVVQRDAVYVRLGRGGVLTTVTDPLYSVAVQLFPLGGMLCYCLTRGAVVAVGCRSLLPFLFVVALLLFFHFASSFPSAFPLFRSEDFFHAPYHVSRTHAKLRVCVCGGGGPSPFSRTSEGKQPNTKKKDAAGQPAALRIDFSPRVCLCFGFMPPFWLCTQFRAGGTGDRCRCWRR